MLWRMHNVRATHFKKTGIYDRMRLTMGYQAYEEARIDRTRNNNNRNKQVEQVGAININIDASKQAGKGEFFYGAEFIHNKVHSFGERTNISNNAVSAYVSRYPDGSKWRTAGAYVSYKYNHSQKLTLLGGLRYSYNSLDATFNKTFINFPYEDAKLRDGALTGNAGLVFRPTDTWQLNANIATGYRMPNVDDIGKLFESVPGNITVPNPNLTPEYAWNFEAGIVKTISGKLRAELTGFYTILDNAIVRRPTTFNGEDSIVFDGVLSRVEALQNVARATVKGIQLSAEYFFTKSLSARTYANWTSGKETDDVKNEQVPLRHAPPFYGSTFIRFSRSKMNVEGYVMYNSKIDNKDLAPSEKSKTDIYAVDDNGMPYSPGWYTLNLKASYQVIKNLTVTAGLENITNQRYRPYSSGIVAAGSNVIVALRASF
jgi:hemoglobin/transferrin/lactoferrin receptor protein